MIKAILTDIEGTTSSQSFVKDVLFPYTREHMADFVRCHAEDPKVAPLLNDVRLISGKERLSVKGVIDQLIEWIDQDKKATPLKTLQGMIWKKGYEDGVLRTHVYDDAEQALRRWKKQGLRLYVYSSGSVQAQKLMFSHTEKGDLTPLFDGYFDTHTGSKLQAKSYRTIAQVVGLEPNQILFLSDTEKELDAAQAAGLKTIWVVRDDILDPDAAHIQVKDFSEIKL